MAHALKRVGRISMLSVAALLGLWVIATFLLLLYSAVGGYIPDI